MWTFPQELKQLINKHVAMLTRSDDLQLIADLLHDGGDKVAAPVRRWAAEDDGDNRASIDRRLVRLSDIDSSFPGGHESERPEELDGRAI